MSGNRLECPECGNMTMKEGESTCGYCRSAIGIPGSVMITGLLVCVLLVIGVAMFA